MAFLPRELAARLSSPPWRSLLLHGFQSLSISSSFQSPRVLDTPLSSLASFSSSAASAAADLDASADIFLESPVDFNIGEDGRGGGEGQRATHARDAPPAWRHGHGHADRPLWHRLPPVEHSDGFLGQNGAPTALKWVEKCCADLPNSFLRKLFRKRQVRILKSTVVRAPVCSDSTLDGSETDLDSQLFQDAEPEHQQLRRVSEGEILSAGTIVHLPAHVTLQRSFAGPNGSQGGESVPSKEVKDHILPSEEDVELLRRRILYKDEHIIVLNKPPGLPVQGGSNVKCSLDSLMASALTFKASESPRLVHRLDKGTSGAMVLGRTQEATRFLHALLREKTAAASALKQEKDEGRGSMRRAYWALVAGTPKSKKGVIDVPLIRVPACSGKSDRVVIAEQNSNRTDSMKAVTQYRVIQTNSTGFTWLELRPLTGRKHQLRVHCASVLGLPIVGDYKYGAWVSDAWRLREEADRGKGEGEDEHPMENMSRPLESRGPGSEVAGIGVTINVAGKGGSESDGSGELGRIERLLKWHGSLRSIKPWLHLHCRHLWLPDLVELKKRGSEGGVREKERHFVAPLSSHMAESWRLLGFRSE